MIWSSFLFVAIACSTPVNCTSCDVNSLVSSGDSGSWYWSCLVSSSRKLSNRSVSVANGLGAGAATDDVVTALTAISGFLLDADIDGAEMARRRHCGGLGQVGRGRFARGRVRVGGAALQRLAELLAALAAQVEGQAAAVGLKTGILQRALQHAGVA